jgi:hypothetical protein
VDIADIVDGDFSATDRSRRNRNLRVAGRGGRGYLIKQADPGEPGSASTLGVEAAFCRLCQHEPALAVTRGWMPRLVEEGGDGAGLVFELLEGAVPLWQHHESRGAPDFPAVVGAPLGRVLGELHASFRQASRLPSRIEDPCLAGLRRARPWILDVHRPGPPMLERLSPANLQLVKIVQGQPGLPERLDAAGDGWRVETVVHGDVKSDNVLVRTDAGVPEPHVSLVDWELVQLGDPAWDVGAALADFLTFWIASIPLTSTKTAAQQVAEARYPLPRIQPALRALWTAYRAAAAMAPEEAAPFLMRAVGYSGARLIQSAFEQSYGATALPNSSVGLLQLAANVLADPPGALRDLLGIPLPPTPAPAPAGRS